MAEPQPSRVRETDPLLQYARRAEGADAETDSARRRECHTRNTKILLWGTGLLTMLGVILGVIIFAVARKNHDDFVFALQEEVTTRDIFKHLEAFQNIAKDHPSGSRSIANAYNASAEYVISTIIDAGVPCSPRKQYFDAPVWSQDQPGMLAVHYPTKSSYTSAQTPPEAQKMIAVDYQEGVDFRSMRYGGLSANIGDATVISISNDGCAGSDFITPTDRSGQVIALILAQENPSCTLFESASMAEKMGYAAVLFYNPANRTSLSNARVRIVEWKTGDPLISIPVMSISNALGMMLLQFSESEKTQATVDLRVFHTLSVHRTFNVLCEIYTGLETISHRTQHFANSEPEYFQANDEDAHGLVVGAHLDSVPTGPGMVDNASGSSTILAILLAMKRLNFWGKHKVVFAWWGAEEVGLLGSRHYVQLLKKQGQIKKIGAALNFDMLGSPNYTPQIHSGESAPEDVRQASISLQKLFERSFVQDEKPFTLSDMYGGSDFLPFLNAGVPANGVLTGAGELKTEEERSKFGGIAGAPLDPCYHKACDTLENVSREAIEQMSRASAYVIATLLSVDNLWEFLNQGMN